MLLLLLSFFSFVNFCVVFFFQAFCYAYVPFRSLFCPFHRVFYFHFILMFTFIAYILRVFFRVCHRCVASFSYCLCLYMCMVHFRCSVVRLPLSTMPNLWSVYHTFFFRIFIWIIVMLCDVLLCILITYILNRKTVVHRMIFGFRFWCDGYLCRLNRTGKKYRTKFIVNRWKFGFAAPPNQ